MNDSLKQNNENKTHQKDLFSIISERFIDCQRKGMSEVASYMQALAEVRI